MKSNNKYGSGIFWAFQLIGWSSVSFVLGYWNVHMNGVSKDIATQTSAVFLVLGILLSFLFRQYMLKDGWLKLSLGKLYIHIIVGSVVFGSVFALILTSVFDLFFDSIEPIITFPYIALLGFIINSTLIFLLWSSIYLNYNYFKNYEKEEIKNLKLIASQNEIELQSLISQLNPHFLFNAMNSIRALIEEDPSLAKNAITKLSSILRNTLVASKKEFVTIEEEIDMTEKYLSLEKIRYEERLSCRMNIEPQTLQYKIPPLLISTLVENAVKHGIANSKDGGEITIDVKLIDQKLNIDIYNPGQYIKDNIIGTGIGLSNTRKRLAIMFGDESDISISNHDSDTVITRVIIPKNN